MRYIRIPRDRLGVSVEEFGAILNAAGHRWQAEPDSVYLGGVRETLEWIAGIHERHPLTRQYRPADSEAMLELQMQADAIVYDMPTAMEGIAPDWALGVASAVGWSRGAQPRPPVPPLKRRTEQFPA